MSDDVRAAFETLRIKLREMEDAVDTLATELLVPLCDNCGRIMSDDAFAYCITKGSITALARHGSRFTHTGSPSKVRSLLLCPGCYDNNWIIDEPDSPPS